MQQLAILSIINLSFLFKKNLCYNCYINRRFAIYIIIEEFKLKSKNTTIDKRVLLASFFAKTMKFVVNIFLILNFNLVTLDFANCERLLKTITIIFLKNFLILIDLSIAITTRKN